MFKNKTWKLPRQKDLDIIEIFLCKSLWYDWCKLFRPLKHHPDMIDWLELNPKRKSDKLVWGKVHKEYNRNHLKAWLVHGGTLKLKKREEEEVNDEEVKKEKDLKEDKGKGKAKEQNESTLKKKDKGKGKAEETEESGSNKKDKHRKPRVSKR